MSNTAGYTGLDIKVVFLDGRALKVARRVHLVS
jgi:hypothetical protein